jgi:hypothetical protein
MQEQSAGVFPAALFVAAMVLQAAQRFGRSGHPMAVGHKLPM